MEEYAIKYAVFHHNDLDGYAAAAVVAGYLEETCDDLTVADAEFLSCNYGDKLVTSKRLQEECNGYPELVFIVDLSFKTEKEMEEVYDMLEHGSKVFWFDHHQSSVNLLERIKDTKFKEYVRDGVLVYDVNVDHCGAYISYTNLFPDIEVPRAIKLVNDWDLWIHNTDDSRYLNNAFYCEEDADEDLGSLKNPWSNYWSEMLGGSHQIPNEDVLDIYLLQGKTIDQYKKMTYKNWFRNYGYVTEFEGYKTVCMNWKINSEVFGDCYDDFPLHLIWGFDGEKYIYSLYTNNAETGIDCSAIAEKYGGGGHKGAAGFTSDKLLVPAGEKVFK